MRTTIDLPEDLHRQAVSIARDTHRTLSETVAFLIRRGLGQTSAGEQVRSSKTGLRTIALGKVITSEDVRSLEDE
ncbi:antitoxin [Nocardia amamiensis]|uniref:antitoxin n=1 Tax=Nocardia amamiensis TaxID=404578 RepID=UPI000833D466|nr:antitoxin [Nocardia amamiensis]